MGMPTDEQIANAKDATSPHYNPGVIRLELDRRSKDFQKKVEEGEYIYNVYTGWRPAPCKTCGGERQAAKDGTFYCPICRSKSSKVFRIAKKRR